MVKSIALLCFVAVLGCANSRSMHQNHHHARHDDAVQHVRQWVKDAGYQFANYTVTTEDGYMLDLFRVQYDGKKSTWRNDRDSSESESREDGDERPAVLLMHNFLSSADDFIMPGPKAGLAFYLAERGYDVYIGNMRGNRYGRRHTTLNPDRDAAFWNFCWHHMGVKDLPAIVDKVLDVSGQSKLYYAGHMQGSTVFYVMASERPEYNDKIHKMASMGPLAYITHSQNPMFKYIAENFNSQEWIIKNLGANRFVPSADLLNDGGKKECMRREKNANLCENVYFLFFGYDEQYFNMSTVNTMLPYLPSGGSSKEALHYARIFKTGKFVKSYEQDSEEYDLSKITAPMAFFYVPEDYVIPEEDVQYLKEKMTVDVKQYKFQELSNNIDLLYAKNVDTIVYKRLADYFGDADKNRV